MVGIIEYFRKKKDEFEEREKGSLLQLAYGLNLEAAVNLAGKVPDSLKGQIAEAVLFKNPEFYAQVATIKKSEELRYMDKLRYCFFSKGLSPLERLDFLISPLFDIIDRLDDLLDTED